ncbi:unnamed protein product [marine sediment metagenome]|uniref:Uncharacterized protein n=1 Tax=marine sediment metagenome TaxID=412755 RepID=X1HYQ7_9ZZZZ
MAEEESKTVSELTWQDMRFGNIYEAWERYPTQNWRLEIPKAHRGSSKVQQMWFMLAVLPR